MILFIFQKTFGLLIGKLPEEKKKELWQKFNELLSALVKAGAEGVTEGAVKGLSERK